MRNNHGKTVTIFLILISVLLLSLTVIAMFFFQKESELRKLAEMNLEQSKSSEAKLQAELKEAKKQVFLLEEKGKETEEKFSDLQADLELAQGVRDQIKEENASLKEALESETSSKEQLRGELDSQVDVSKKRIAELESRLKELEARGKLLPRNSSLPPSSEFAAANMRSRRSRRGPARRRSAVVSRGMSNTSLPRRTDSRRAMLAGHRAQAVGVSSLRHAAQR